MIDLDSNATTAMLPEVLDAMLPWLRDHYANPSGSYAAAKHARKAIDIAREQVAQLLGTQPDEIVFTGGGTESVNTALHSLHSLCAHGPALTSAVEHSAVLRCLDTLPREVVKLPVDRAGRLKMNELVKAVEGSAFLSVMAANNETGVIQPLQEVISITREAGIPVHSDAIQAFGKIPFTVTDYPADLISLSAHKFHGPKGVGALYIRNNLKFEPLILGGGQESGRRSGTENTAAIVGMGAAAAAASRELADGLDRRLAALRDSFEKEVIDSLDGVWTNGDHQHRLPNTSHLSFDGCEASGLLVLLDEAGIQCSAGSACMTGKQEPSHVQIAMGISSARSKSSLRFGFSKLNDQEDASSAAQAVVSAVTKLREVQGSGTGPVSVYSP